MKRYVEFVSTDATHIVIGSVSRMLAHARVAAMLIITTLLSKAYE